MDKNIRPMRQFHCGDVIASVDIMTLFQAANMDLGIFLIRHCSGDWGNVSEQLKQHNAHAMPVHGALVSVYAYDGYHIKIVTGDRHRYTTVSLLEDMTEVDGDALSVLVH
jgi:hypothetical protein